jgi:hypothetical protein
MTDDPLAALVLAIERADMTHYNTCPGCNDYTYDELNVSTTIAESIAYQLSMLGYTIRKKDK